jgi:hypothetical protein
MKYLHKKFIVVSDMSTRVPLEIFFADGLADLHSEIFAEAQRIWKSSGKSIVCNGGGRFSMIDDYVVFYSLSQAYGRFENSVVAALAKKHPIFSNEKYKIICRAGSEDPWQLIEDNGSSGKVGRN